MKGREESAEKYEDIDWGEPIGTAVFLGWDVGAWHCDHGDSRDALVGVRCDEGGSLQLVGDYWRGNLRQCLNEHGGDLPNRLLALCGPVPELEAHVDTLAIDTPLAWPRAMIGLATAAEQPAPNIPDRSADNPLVYRYVERWLWENGHMPLSPVKDMIGSQATKGMCFLRKVDATRIDEPQGAWVTDQGCSIIETYPSPAKQSTLLADYHNSIADQLENQLAGVPDAERSDVVDAVVCAIVAYMFRNQRDELAPPREAAPQDEGWIWVPKDCLRD